VDPRLAERVRAVLHAPGFQALEAVWRGLAALVQEAETGEALRIHVLDAARDEAPLLLAEELATPGAPRPTCVLAAYRFDASEHDLAVLERFGAVALAAGVPLVGDGSPALLGLDDARQLGDANVRRRIGLPRARACGCSVRCGCHRGTLCRRACWRVRRTDRRASW
jgi:type VI secretion system protein ImpC